MPEPEPTSANPETLSFQPLQAIPAAELENFWSAAHPLHPMPSEALQRRLLDPRNSAPELMLSLCDEQNRLAAIGVGCYPVREIGIGGVRWLGVAPVWRGKGLEAQMLSVLCERLKQRGAHSVRLFATPPYYLRPGVDTRETDLIATLIDLGWCHDVTNFNMSVDLGQWSRDNAHHPRLCDGTHDAPYESPAGYRIMRAARADRMRFADYMSQVWTPTWRAEADQAFESDPITLFLAIKDNAIAGFAACEVSQCLGGFGPTGVSTEHRGAGLGRMLLYACLQDLAQRGRKVCEIGWVGPVSFYYRACGASLSPSYWVFSKPV